MQISIIDLKESLLSDNDRDADKLRVELRAQKTFYLNVMSSPGSGKTSCILRTLEQLGKTFRCGVMEADIDSAVDARIFSKTSAILSARQSSTPVRVKTS